MVEVSPLLYAVAAALAAHHLPKEAAEVVSSAVGRRVTVDNIEYLVETKLRPLGVLGETPLGGPSRSTLSLTVRAGVIPAGVVGWLANGLRCLFLPPVVGLVLSALVLFDVWLLSHGLGSAMEDVVAHSALALTVIALTLLGGLFHELGHAAASRYAGARPGVIGVGIYLLWPVFYNDLNDSYRLDCAGRLRCDLGGVYFNGVFVLVLGFAYAVMGGDVLLLAAAVQHLAILQQFLPFVRLDGYYLVSDLAGLPDLFRYARPILRSLLPGPQVSEVASLRPRVRALVVAWVLVTVPLLAVCAGVLIVRLPDLLMAAWRASAVQSQAVLAAVKARDPASAAVAVLSLALVAVPLVGLTAAALGRLRRDSPSCPAASVARTDVSSDAWAAVIDATDDPGLPAEDRWDAPDAASSLCGSIRKTAGFSCPTVGPGSWNDLCSSMGLRWSCRSERPGPTCPSKSPPSNLKRLGLLIRNRTGAIASSQLAGRVRDCEADGVIWWKSTGLPPRKLVVTVLAGSRQCGLPAPSRPAD